MRFLYLQNLVNQKNIRKYLNENGYTKADINAKAYVNLDEYKVELIYIITKTSFNILVISIFKIVQILVKSFYKSI